MGAPLWFSRLGAMGKKLIDTAPGISWSQYSTGALLQSIQDIVVELSARDQSVVQPEREPGIGAESASAGTSSSTAAPVLKEPWSCGYRCQWCEQPCKRKEGHSNHSCYEHRHRR